MARILHVYRTFFPDTQGGAEEVIRQLAKGGAQFGHDVRIFTLSSRVEEVQDIEFDGLTITRAPEWFEVASCNVCYRGLGVFRRLARWADIVHFHFPWPFGDLLRALVPSDTRTVVTYHSDIVRQRTLLKLYSPLMHRFLASVDSVVSTSPNYLRTSTTLQVYRDKTTVVPIGLDESHYPKPSPTMLEVTRQRVGEGFFLFVGVLRYYKGLHILLDACANQEFRAVIVGAGPIENELKEHARQLGLTNVVFLGFVGDEEKMALFQLCKAVVFPSYLRSEAFGVTLLEGAMCCKPLISSEMGTGTSYVNIDGETGLCVKPGDVESLREAMLTLDADSDLCQWFGSNARARFETFFTARQMNQGYDDVYRRLLLGTAGGPSARGVVKPADSISRG